MATQTYRYKWLGVVQDEVARIVPGAEVGDITISGLIDPMVTVDIMADESRKATLDEVMLSFGWQFQEQIL